VRFSLQNPSSKGLRAKYHETKELHGIFGWELLAFAGFTSLAGAMMDEFWVRRKVGCHKGV
jgi:hypothetical protein